jgi:hypothetical protein
MAVGVVEIQKREPLYGDYEWTAIKPMLPNKPRDISARE